MSPMLPRGTFTRRNLVRGLWGTAWLLAQVLISPVAVATPGHLDPAFGGDGKVTTAPTRHGGFANAIAIQADGRMVAVGTSLGRRPRFAVVRYDTDGTLDPTFGREGRAVTNFANGDEQGQALAIQADGKIVIGGQVAWTDSDWDFALARYSPDGTLDPTFGGEGKVTTSFSRRRDIAYGVAVQADGKIVVAGSSGGGGDSRFALARYNTDGTLDTTFGGDGRITTDFIQGIDYGVSAADALAIQSDGKIVAAGTAGNRPALARYNTDGTLDPTFGGDGEVMLPVNCCPVFVGIFDATVQPDGRIVTAGERFECFMAQDCERNPMLVRYNTDGTLDTTFGSGGIALGLCGSTNALALQVDGRIVVAGTGCGTARGDFLLARYTTNGTLDASFGRGGRVLTSFARNWDEARGVAIQVDGKIVVSGVSGSRFALARYLSS